MKKILSLLVAATLAFSTSISPAVFAKDAPVAILDQCAEDDGNGEGVICILKLVIDIMSVGVGILGVIGIAVVGIQYLTAGGNEEKARKAKIRILEIVIGLVAYVLLYAILRWLLPGFEGVDP